MITTRACAVCMSVLGLSGMLAPASAADTRYPSRPIRFIMPYPVGGTIDMSGRLLAQQLGENLG